MAAIDLVGIFFDDLDRSICRSPIHNEVLDLERALLVDNATNCLLDVGTLIQ
jgi:hypothetical protein